MNFGTEQERMFITHGLFIHSRCHNEAFKKSSGAGIYRCYTCYMLYLPKTVWQFRMRLWAFGFLKLSVWLHQYYVLTCKQVAQIINTCNRVWPYRVDDYGSGGKPLASTLAYFTLSIKEYRAPRHSNEKRFLWIQAMQRLVSMLCQMSPSV